MGANPSKMYMVHNVWLDTAVARTAFSVAFGDMLRNIAIKNRTPDKWRIDYDRMATCLVGSKLELHAAAWLSTLDYHRRKLMKLHEAGEPVQRMFDCIPTGAVFTPGWHTKRTCGVYMCPWCRYRRVEEIVRRNFTALETKVYWYRCVRDFDTAEYLNRTFDRVTKAQKVGLAKIKTDYVRLCRIGLDIDSSGTKVLRSLHGIVSLTPIKGMMTGKAEEVGFRCELVPYSHAIYESLRFACGNLMEGSELADQLKLIKRIRTFDIVRHQNPTESVKSESCNSVEAIENWDI